MSERDSLIRYEQNTQGEWVAIATECGHEGNPDEMADGYCVNCQPLSCRSCGRELGTTAHCGECQYEQVNRDYSPEMMAAMEKLVAKFDKEGWD